MIKVVRKDGETVDHLYKRFKNKSMHDGIRKEIEKRRAYIKPGDRRRAKHTAAIRRMKRNGSIG